MVRIADYWPEFGQKGKEKTTVADLMRHEVGLGANPKNVNFEVKSLESCAKQSIKPISQDNSC